MEIVFEDKGVLRTLRFDATIKEEHTQAAVVTQHPVERGIAVTDHIRPERLTLRAEVHISNTPVKASNTDVLVQSADGNFSMTPGVAEPWDAVGDFAPLLRDDFVLRRRLLRRGAQVNGSNQTRELLMSLRDTPLGSSLPGVNPILRRVTPQQNATAEEAIYEQDEVRVTPTTLQFPFIFQRDAEAWNMLRRLCTEGFILNFVTTSLRQYENMVIQNVSVPRDVASRHSALYTIEFIQVRIAESTVTKAPDPVEERAKKKVNEGAQGDTPATEAEIEQSFLKYGSDRPSGGNPIVEGLKTVKNAVSAALGG